MARTGCVIWRKGVFEKNSQKNEHVASPLRSLMVKSVLRPRMSSTAHGDSEWVHEKVSGRPCFDDELVSSVSLSTVT